MYNCTSEYLYSIFTRIFMRETLSSYTHAKYFFVLLTTTSADGRNTERQTFTFHYKLFYICWTFLLIHVPSSDFYLRVPEFRWEVWTWFSIPSQICEVLFKKRWTINVNANNCFHFRFYVLTATNITTHRVSRIIQRRTIGASMKDELERLWKETLVALGTIPAFSWRDWERPWKTQVE
jgi:hypothetical protein